MRMIVAGPAFIALAMSAMPSTAEIIYPWCAQYGGRDGRNCGFSTLQQCRAAISGNGGYCLENPMYQPIPAPIRSRRP